MGDVIKRNEQGELEVALVKPQPGTCYAKGVYTLRLQVDHTKPQSYITSKALINLLDCGSVHGDTTCYYIKVAHPTSNGKFVEVCVTIDDSLADTDILLAGRDLSGNPLV